MSTEKKAPPAGAPDEKRIQLYLSQRRTLSTFLERGAITRAQYEKSLGDLTRLMGMEEVAAKEEATQ